MTNRYLIPARIYSLKTSELTNRLVGFLELTQPAAQAIMGLHEHLFLLGQRIQNISALKLQQLSGLYFTDDPNLNLNVESIRQAEGEPDRYEVTWYQMPVNEVLIGRQGVQWTASDDPTHPAFLIQTDSFPLEALKEIATGIIVDEATLKPLMSHPGFTLTQRETSH